VFKEILKLNGIFLENLNKCACVGGDSSVPLGFVSLSENLFMIAGALIMLFL